MWEGWRARGLWNNRNKACFLSSNTPLGNIEGHNWKGDIPIFTGVNQLDGVEISTPASWFAPVTEVHNWEGDL